MNVPDLEKATRMNRTTRLRLATMAGLLALTGALGACARAVAPAATPPAAPAVTRSTTQRPVVTSSRGIVASAHPLASDAGIAQLRAGGNAVDAAVAAAFAIGVAEPNASGLGGEGMMLIHLADSGTTVAIDYRSAAPARAAAAGRPPATGYAAVAVPGTVAGLTLALEKYGTRTLAEVMAPAIRIADEGFVAGPTLANVVTENFAGLIEDAPIAAVFCPDGLPLEAGRRVRNPDLAATLRAIAAGGAAVFYRGAIAERIAAASAAGGGVSREDLATYRAIEREPVRGRYRGHDVVSAPPPVAGITVLEALQVLDRFDLQAQAPFSTARLHLTSEALKRAFADFSAFVADPGFVKVPAAGLLSPEYATRRAAEIRPDAVTPVVEAGDPDRESPSTTSLTVIDGHGNAVVLTQTISDFFGAKVMVPGTGIILNNELKNFSARGINAIAPGKRMRTTIAPTIVLKDGKTVLAVGTPGAARIVSTMTLLISNVVDYGMGVQEAIDAPRFHVRDTEAAIALEARIPAATQEELKRLGYTIDLHGDFDLFFGGAQGILRNPATGVLTGGADPRRDGAVIVY